MKTASLVVLIFAALDILNTALRGGLGLRAVHTAPYIASYAISLLFIASLFYFFLVFYKSQKS